MMKSDRSWLDREEAGEGKNLWERRRRMRERARVHSEVWDLSPERPKRLEDRFEVGADERKRKERKRKRKEERRKRRDEKRARRTEGKPLVAVTKGQEEKEQQEQEGDSEEDEDLGPALPATEKTERALDYGKALRPGEGTAMAAFVQDGARIPRRGEIGLTSDEIEKFEDEGFVMSGSRNRRMEAVRIRKENQIYSAEELAALRQYSQKERKEREEKMLNQMKMLVESRGKQDEDEKV